MSNSYYINYTNMPEKVNDISSVLTFDKNRPAAYNSAGCL